LSCCSSNGGRTESTHTGWAKPTQGSPMRIGEEGGGEKLGTVLAEAEEGGAAQQQWHRTASECAEAPRRGALPCVVWRGRVSPPPRRVATNPLFFIPKSK
jgi:hypothetical protein